MANLFASLNHLPAVVKVGWILWMTWGAAQVLWFRRARVVSALPASMAAVPVGPVRRRRPAAPRPSATVQADTVIVPTGNGSVLGLS